MTTSDEVGKMGDRALARHIQKLGGPLRNPHGREDEEDEG